MISSSPFFSDSASQLSRSEQLLHKERALPAIKSFLSESLPLGAVVGVIFPKEILTSLLPAIARERQLTIVPIGASTELLMMLEKEGVLALGPTPKIDVYITEPDGFVSGGALVKPHETTVLSQIPVIGVGSSLQKTKDNPATHDFVPLAGMITEHGTVLRKR